ncbi:MAG: response regulator transcription factor [Bradymonadaceae bacterium]
MARRAVVADDDETIRSILRHKLSADGFEPEVCRDGKEAKEVLDARDPDLDPDLAILDVMMPRLNGIQLLRMIRRNELVVDPELPVVMLTSRGREADVLDGLESGADEYMTKPFSPAELLARVNKLLE